MTKITDRQALLVQAVESYGSHYIHATVVLPLPEDATDYAGERDFFGSPEWWKYVADNPAARARAFVGFRIRFHVGHSYRTSGDSDPGEVWGFTVEYAGENIQRHEQATVMAQTLRKIENGLRKIADAEGYTEDPAMLIMRVGRVLKIGEVWVRNAREQRERTGDRYRKSDGSHLQWWIQNVSDLAGKRQFEAVTSWR